MNGEVNPPVNNSSSVLAGVPMLPDALTITNVTPPFVPAVPAVVALAVDEKPVASTPPPASSTAPPPAAAKGALDALEPAGAGSDATYYVKDAQETLPSDAQHKSANDMPNTDDRQPAETHVDDDERTETTLAKSQEQNLEDAHPSTADHAKAAPSNSDATEDDEDEDANNIALDLLNMSKHTTMRSKGGAGAGAGAGAGSTAGKEKRPREPYEPATTNHASNTELERLPPPPKKKSRRYRTTPADSMRQLLRIIRELIPKSKRGDVHGMTEKDICSFLDATFGKGGPERGFAPQPKWGTPNGWSEYIKTLFAWALEVQGSKRVVTEADVERCCVRPRGKGRSWEVSDAELHQLGLNPSHWQLPVSRQSVLNAPQPPAVSDSVELGGGPLGAAAMTVVSQPVTRSDEQAAVKADVDMAPVEEKKEGKTAKEAELERQLSDANSLTRNFQRLAEDFNDALKYLLANDLVVGHENVNPDAYELTIALFIEKAKQEAKRTLQE